MRWIETQDKAVQYKAAKDFVSANGMTQSNTSMITLLPALGKFNSLKEFKKLLLDFTSEIPDKRFLISIETTIEADFYDFSKLIRRNYSKEQEVLPFYHCHILVEDLPRPVVQSLKQKWSNITGSKRKSLFKYGPLEKSILNSLNYCTKLTEEKMEGECYLGLPIKQYTLITEIPKQKELIDSVKQVELMFNVESVDTAVLNFGQQNVKKKVRSSILNFRTLRVKFISKSLKHPIKNRQTIRVRGQP